MSGFGETDYLLKALQTLLPGKPRLEETPLGYGEIPLGWHSVLFLEGEVPFAGGTAATRGLSRRISIAESFERGLVQKILHDPPLARDLLLNDVPTCSGFAAGFQSHTTHERSLFEAVERWAWSQWIDEKNIVFPLKTPPTLSPFETYLTQPFKEKIYLERQFPIRFNSYRKDVSFKVFLGLTEEGIFPGSRVSETKDRSWTHSIIEAHRNFQNFGQPALFPLTRRPDDVIAKRASYFSKRKVEALEQIENCTNDQWPQTAISLWKKVETNISGIFLSRAVCSSHIPWHLGPVNRFVY